MNKRIILLLLMLIPLTMISQKKKRKKEKQTLEQQVEEARQQEAAAKQQGGSNASISGKPNADIGAKLISFNVVTSKEKLVFDTDFNPHKPIILVLFNPSCGHCKEVAMGMKKSYEQLKEASIVFVCGKELLGELAGFSKEVDVDQVPNMTIASDNSEVIKLLFEYNGIPQIMIYNKEHRLTKKFYKLFNADSVAHYMRQ
ncbi:MAG: hypothetical protein JNJ58_06580 [Chitinophagaceae bacterium]|nr:hypothetical protein [Chitinophagaceae bacterium]